MERVAYPSSFAAPSPSPTINAAAASPVVSSSGLAAFVRRFSALVTSTGPPPPAATWQAAINAEVPARCEPATSRVPMAPAT